MNSFTRNILAKSKLVAAKLVSPKLVAAKLAKSKLAKANVDKLWITYPQVVHRLGVVPHYNTPTPTCHSMPDKNIALI